MTIIPLERSGRETENPYYNEVFHTPGSPGFVFILPDERATKIDPLTHTLISLPEYRCSPHRLICEALAQHPEWNTQALEAFIRTTKAHKQLAKQLGIEYSVYETISFGNEESSLKPWHQTPDLSFTLTQLHRPAGTVLDYLPSTTTLNNRCFLDGVAAYVKTQDAGHLLRNARNGMEGFIYLPPPPGPELEITVKEHITELQTLMGLSFIQENAPDIIPVFLSLKEDPVFIEWLNTALEEEGAFNISNTIAWALNAKFGINKIPFRQAVAKVSGKNFGWRAPVDKSFLDLREMERAVIEALPLLQQEQDWYIAKFVRNVFGALEEGALSQLQPLIAGSYGFGYQIYKEKGNYHFRFHEDENLLRFVTFVLLHAKSHDVSNAYLRKTLRSLAPSEQSLHQMERVFELFNDQWPIHDFTFERDERIGIDASGLMVYIQHRSKGPEAYSIDSALTVFDKKRVANSGYTNKEDPVPEISYKDPITVPELLTVAGEIYAQAIDLKGIVATDPLLFREVDIARTAAGKILYSGLTRVCAALDTVPSYKEFCNGMNAQIRSLIGDAVEGKDSPSAWTGQPERFTTIQTLFWLKIRELLFSDKAEAFMVHDAEHFAGHDLKPRLQLHYPGMTSSGYPRAEELAYGPIPYTQKEVMKMLREEFLYGVADGKFEPTVEDALESIVFQHFTTRSPFTRKISGTSWLYKLNRVVVETPEGTRYKDIPPQLIPEYIARAFLDFMPYASVDITSFSSETEQSFKAPGDEGRATISPAELKQGETVKDAVVPAIQAGKTVVLVVDAHKLHPRRKKDLPQETVISLLGVDSLGNAIVYDPLRPVRRATYTAPLDDILATVQGNGIHIVGHNFLHRTYFEKKWKEKTPEVPEEPTHFSFEGELPHSFDELHTMVEGVIADTPDSSPAFSPTGKAIMQKHRRLQKLLVEAGIPLKDSRILRGPNGGILAFHRSSIMTPAHIVKTAVSGKTGSRPLSGESFWGVRCFGPSITFAPEPHYFMNGIRTEQDLEKMTGMELFSGTKWSVLFKQLYWHNNTRYIWDLIQKNPYIKQEWEEISGYLHHFQFDLQKTLSGRLAFALSGALIDTLHHIDSRITRPAGRAAVQERLGVGFGWRSYTDYRFVDPAELAKTVPVMCVALGITGEQRDRVDVAARLVLENTELFLEDELVELHNGKVRPVHGDFSLLAHVAMNNADVRELLRTKPFSSVSEKYSQLLQLLDGFYPFAETATMDGMLPREPFYFGTDGGTNNVISVRGPLREDQFRVLSDEELRFYFHDMIT